jgi:hypothetical protein
MSPKASQIPSNQSPLADIEKVKDEQGEPVIRLGIRRVVLEPLVFSAQDAV